MGVRSTKDIIREARRKAGLTQEQLADGICSLQALSRIETGVSGVSPATFQALMERAGAPCHRFPVFAGRDDFDCYYRLKRAGFYLDAWQLPRAWDELRGIEEMGWADNRLYCQEWLLLQCRLQFRSYCGSHQSIYDALLDALHITRPDICLSDFRHLMLSQIEIRLLTALAQEELYLGRPDGCLAIHGQIAEYLANSKFTYLEKERMQAEDAVVYAKYLIAMGEYAAGLETADFHRHRMAGNVECAPLFELCFLTGLCHHHLGNPDRADVFLKAVFYSAQAVDSCYAAVCREYLCQRTDFLVTEYMRSLEAAPLKAYPFHGMDGAGLADGVYDTDSPDIYTFGDLIRELRTEQKISQQTLCRGLCSASKLSKIEAGDLQPDIALAEALLQRLGISERAFTFWGSEKDARFYDLKFKLIHDQLLPKETRREYQAEMERLVDGESALYRQEYLVDIAYEPEDPRERILRLSEALGLTLPDFDIYNLSGCRLTWQELSILNLMARSYQAAGEQGTATLYYSHILHYVEKNRLDVLFLNTFLMNVYLRYCQTLYRQNRHAELIALYERIDIAMLKCNINHLGGYLFYYSQVLAEASRTEEAVLAAVQSCALNDSVGLFRNAPALRRAFLEEFSVELKY